LELQLAGDLDFRAETTTGGDKTIGASEGAEIEAGLGLRSVLGGGTRITAETELIIAIQSSRIARDHTW